MPICDKHDKGPTLSLQLSGGPKKLVTRNAALTECNKFGAAYTFSSHYSPYYTTQLNCTIYIVHHVWKTK